MIFNSEKILIALRYSPKLVVDEKGDVSLEHANIDHISPSSMVRRVHCKAEGPRGVHFRDGVRGRCIRGETTGVRCFRPSHAKEPPPNVGQYQLVADGYISMYVNVHCTRTSSYMMWLNVIYNEIDTERMATVKHKILVLSGKGGVGKSTFSAQLAFALSSMDYQVGLLDIDICGPRIPKMLGLEGQGIHHSNLARMVSCVRG
ncbi:hypothetical protein Sjap_008202 [Stephania japonica]|uniref:Uncharacterized protein n=1 Tax=Stephania japonica TaxID=461633 RepID=A0AAP0JP19_9MAGN